MPATRVPLWSIPPIQELYGQGKIIGASRTLFPPNEYLNQKISVWKGDITTIEADSIVNAANSSLLGGGGVDGAIHKAAGSDLLKECKTLNGCKTGNSKITKGYNLPAKHVIHTVGPVYHAQDSQNCAAHLAGCYRTSLHLAAENSLKSIAFSSISTGVYGYPIKDATEIALHTTRNFLESSDGQNIDRVIFVTFLDKDYDQYMELIPKYFPKL